MLKSFEDGLLKEVPTGGGFQVGAAHWAIRKSTCESPKVFFFLNKTVRDAFVLKTNLAPVELMPAGTKPSGGR